MFCIVYELLYDNYMGITWQLYVKYKVITRMAFSIASAVFPSPPVWMRIPLVQY